MAAFSLQQVLLGNTNKTETIIFNTSGRLLAETFKYHNINLKTVDTFVCLPKNHFIHLWSFYADKHKKSAQHYY